MMVSKKVVYLFSHNFWDQLLLASKYEMVRAPQSAYSKVMDFFELCRKSRYVIRSGLPVARSFFAPKPVLSFHGTFEYEY